ncbi:hypothetical protein REPUB_Repub06bG0195300 [Reevesia pubescens]
MIILETVSTKVGRSKKAKIKTKLKKEVKGFEWPIDELKVFVEGNSKNANRGSLKNREVVDLNNDSNSIGNEDEEEIGSLFQSLKKMALKKINH